MTATLGLLNHAKRVFILVTGKSKATALRAGLEGSGPLPIQQVAPRNGELVWLVDVAAASRLDWVRSEASAQAGVVAPVAPEGER